MGCSTVVWNEEKVATGSETKVGGPLSGAIAFVTGSGRGLGRTIAEKLIALGADVAIHDISEDAPAQYGEAANLTEVAKLLSRGGTRIVSVTGDITKEALVMQMVQIVERTLGPISILVNCAGGDIGAEGKKPSQNGALDISMADMAAVFERNFVGTFLRCRAVCSGMSAREKGTVINIGSLNAHQDKESHVPIFPPYCQGIHTICPLGRSCDACCGLHRH
jgi:3-oxoacyl-[acyl-carrier protein] reductase